MHFYVVIFLFYFIFYENIKNYLQCCLCTNESALNWFKSYVSDRFFFVSIGKTSFNFVKLSYGIPQGSIFRPLKFSTYRLPLTVGYGHQRPYVEDEVTRSLFVMYLYCNTNYQIIYIAYE